MSVELLIANLLRVAAEDLDGARLLASKANRNAIYLCEQAAEKVIRAVVTSEGQRAGIKHQLNDIVDMVPDANPIKPAAYRYPKLPKCAKSSGSTRATSNDRRAFAAYLPRGSRRAVPKSTSGISRSERLLGSVFFIGSPLAFGGPSSADDSEVTARRELREDDENDSPDA